MKGSIGLDKDLVWSELIVSNYLKRPDGLPPNDLHSSLSVTKSSRVVVSDDSRHKESGRIGLRVKQ